MARPKKKVKIGVDFDGLLYEDVKESFWFSVFRFIAPNLAYRGRIKALRLSNEFIKDVKSYNAESFYVITGRPLFEYNSVKRRVMTHTEFLKLVLHNELKFSRDNLRFLMNVIRFERLRSDTSDYAHKCSILSKAYYLITEGIDVFYESDLDVVKELEVLCPKTIIKHYNFNAQYPS